MLIKESLENIEMWGEQGKLPVAPSSKEDHYQRFDLCLIVV